MTKQFLEVQYPQNPVEFIKGYPPEIIRLEVANKAEATILYGKLDASIKEHPHTAYHHMCNHSQTGNAPCELREFAKVEPTHKPAPR